MKPRILLSDCTWYVIVGEGCVQITEHCDLGGKMNGYRVSCTPPGGTVGDMKSAMIGREEILNMFQWVASRDEDFTARAGRWLHGMAETR
jgi:hypothetical protein